MPTRCFWSEPAPFADESLRRYSHKSTCYTDDHNYQHYHDASVQLGEMPFSLDGTNGWGHDDMPHDDPRWPTSCARCGYLFPPEDAWQHNLERKYARADTGERFTLRKPPPGAMWDAHWMGKFWTGADGRCLIVVLPNGHEWNVDGRASNCTKPDDSTHRCWVRHGEPPNVTVDKSGDTCDAGGGSIQAGDYHGFLRNGILDP